MWLDTGLFTKVRFETYDEIALDTDYIIGGFIGMSPTIYEPIKLYHILIFGACGHGTQI